MKLIAAVIVLLSGLFATQATLAAGFPVAIEHSFGIAGAIDGGPAIVPAIPK